MEVCLRYIYIYIYIRIELGVMAIKIFSLPPTAPGLVWFDGISTIVSYLILNPVYTLVMSSEKGIR